ncbi:hypothetical protein F070042J6_31970 [Bacteroides sp. f07]|uniref:hypothetical protein n=1 Tax=Bacteroides sp. f07 TaxID=3132704 RepID=UPI0034A7B47C
MRKFILPVLSLLIFGACSNDTEKAIDSSETPNEETIFITDPNVSIKKGKDILVFNSEEDFQKVVFKLSSIQDNKEASTRSTETFDNGTYNNIIQTPDINFKENGFYSLYDYFMDAMNEAESYYDRPGGYEEFKAKYSMLYFPEQGDDYSAYLPIKNENVAKLANANGEISINGKIMNLKDISSYQQLVNLGITPAEEGYSIPTTRDYPINALPEVKCNNRRLWAIAQVRRGSSPGVAEEIAILVRFRKKGLFGKWYNYGSTTEIKFEPNGNTYSKSGNSTHEYLWARIYHNGTPAPFQGLVSVKFQGFGAKCGGTKYYFRVNL